MLLYRLVLAEQGDGEVAQFLEVEAERVSIQPAATSRECVCYLLGEDVCVVRGLHQCTELAELPPPGQEDPRHVPQELVVRACTADRSGRL